MCVCARVCMCARCWLPSCWQSNGSVHCCLRTVCDVWDSFEILGLKWGPHLSPHGQVWTKRQMDHCKVVLFCGLLRMLNGLDCDILCHSLFSLNPNLTSGTITISKIRVWDFSFKMNHLNICMNYLFKGFQYYVRYVLPSLVICILLQQSVGYSGA